MTSTPSPVLSAELTLDQLVALDSILAKWDLNQHGLRQELRDNLAHAVSRAEEKSRQEGYENAIDDVLKVPIIQRSIFDDGSVATALQEALNRIQKEKTFTSPEATSKESA